MNSRYSFLKRGAPLWLTSLPFYESPGVLAFLVAMARAFALTFALLVGLFPLFYWLHGDRFEFGIGEAVFFAFVIAFFEDHARWNYVLNANRPLVAATKFAVLITAGELCLAYAGAEENVSLLYVAYLRIPALVVHFALSYVAAWFSVKQQRSITIGFVLSVVAHTGFNVLGLGGRVMSMLGA